ncbi:MAG: TIGR00730 family Rossman fold protein [Gemmatimonadetes bacterium]|nr:TIGR00730 family Rossman fold protein [Gemmatimonadota bacterium]
MRRVAVYCASNSGARPAYERAAAALGRAFAEAGWAVVYGGGRVGMMGALADAALAAGGEVIGVIPHGLVQREVAHHRLTALHVVDSMHERKAMMADLADAFVTLPGGIGTLEEFFEAWTWGQLGVHRKPVALLDVDDYWAPLLAMLRHAEAEGFLRGALSEWLMVYDTPEAVVRGLPRVTPPAVRRWLRLGET